MGNIERVLFDQWRKPNTAGVIIASSMSFEKINYNIGKKCILNNISLHFEAGKILCLLGPSGSGKTSLLRIAAGLERQSMGRVLLDGREIAGKNIFLPAEKRGIGLVFQDYALFPHLNIIENVKFGLTRLSKKSANDYAMHVLAMVGMEEFSHSYPHEISGGEQQRIALARALAPKPGILLMDEPFSGLDARLRDNIRLKTLELLHEIRATAVIVTHDPEEALRIADNIALMNSGKLVQYGTCEQLYNAPKNLFVASFFSELNLFSGVVTKKTVNTPLGKIAADSHKEGSYVNIGIRQTDIKLTTPVPDQPVARVRSRRIVGSSELIELSFQGYNRSVWARLDVDILERNVDYLSVDLTKLNPFIFDQ